ncbi:MAG: hypothetical protein PHP64_07435 [Actinomycetota bacterium]|nr:hypothetical protein [Actinomycetota bacterium]
MAAAECYLRRGETCGSRTDIVIGVSDNTCSMCEVGKISRQIGCTKPVPVFDKLIDVTSHDSSKPEFTPGLANQPPYPGGVICQETGRRVILSDCVTCKNV